MAWMRCRRPAGTPRRIWPPIERSAVRRRATDALVGRGLYKAVGWTFTAPTLHDRLRLPEDDPRRRAPIVENPLSDDQSLLRTTLLGSLLDVAAHNCARGMVDFGLFEIGTLFVLDGDSSPSSTNVREHRSLAVLLSGRTAPATWGAPDPPRADVFAIKGVLEALGAALRLQLECCPGVQPFLHPGRLQPCCATAKSWVGWASCTRWSRASGGSRARR